MTPATECLKMHQFIYFWVKNIYHRQSILYEYGIAWDRLRQALYGVLTSLVTKQQHTNPKVIYTQCHNSEYLVFIFLYQNPPYTFNTPSCSSIAWLLMISRDVSHSFLAMLIFQILDMVSGKKMVMDQNTNVWLIPVKMTIVKYTRNE